MLADLSKVAGALREETLATQIATRRNEILRELREKGAFTFREGKREFTIKIPALPKKP